MLMKVIHVAGDTDAGVRFSALMGGHAEPALLGNAAPEPSSQLMLLWSRQAESDGAAGPFTQMARACTVTLCTLDDAPVPPQLAASVAGRLNGPAFERAAGRRREKLDEKGPALRWISAGALASGAARAVAVIALFGGMALVARAAAPQDEYIVGLRETLPEMQMVEEAGVTANAFAVGRLMQERELRALTNALSREHETVRLEANAKLLEAAETLSDAEAFLPVAGAPVQVAPVHREGPARMADSELRGSLPI